LTPDEIAEFLRVPVDTVSAWRSKGTGPAFLRIGRYVRYRPEDFDAWMESQRG